MNLVLFSAIYLCLRRARFVILVLSFSLCLSQVESDVYRSSEIRRVVCPTADVRRFRALRGESARSSSTFRSEHATVLKSSEPDR